MIKVGPTHNCLFALQPGAGRVWCYCVPQKGRLQLPQQPHQVSHPPHKCLHALLPRRENRKPLSPMRSFYKGNLQGGWARERCGRFTVGLRQDSIGSPQNQPRLTPKNPHSEDPTPTPRTNLTRCTVHRNKDQNKDQLWPKPSWELLFWSSLVFTPQLFPFFHTAWVIFIFVVYMYIFCVRNSPREMTITCIELYQKCITNNNCENY